MYNNFKQGQLNNWAAYGFMETRFSLTYSNFDGYKPKIS